MEQQAGSRTPDDPVLHVRAPSAASAALDRAAALATFLASFLDFLGAPAIPSADATASSMDMLPSRT